MRSEQGQVVLPSGVVTFLLTDIEGSTRLWESRVEGVAEAMRRHHDILGDLISRFGGVRPRDQGEGDSLLAVFQSASDAAACAIAIQDALAQEPWPSDIQVRVRMSLHSGEPDLRDQHNYMGAVISRAARIRALAAGGQILVSESTALLLDGSLPDGAKVEKLGDFRLRDLSRLERLFELRYPGAPDFPPLRGTGSGLNNMPVWLSNYIDRPDEAQAISKALAESRLVCVAGPGGCGKTRLALHVASSKVDEFADGVWVVDLAPVVDDALIEHKVAASLGMVGSSEAGMSLEDKPLIQGLRAAITGFLSDRELLLVLDNCEHLVDPLADLSQHLLNSCPSLKILATTRESLGLPAEVVYRVPPMALPGPQATIDELSDHAAVKLFVERASQVKPSFTLDHGNARMVSEICERLDGLPLAIELAAAKVKVMSILDISSRLTDHFRLLTGGSRTALERQQTLRGTVDWSYQLCTEEQKTALRRISVFAGGCTLSSAEEVCADDILPADQVLDVITGLVDKSLLVVDDSGEQARYRMLETIKQFAREKLAETDEIHRIRDAHADHYLHIAESGDFPIHCADEPEALELLDDEQQNLNAAMEWLISSARVEEACRMGWALYGYWVARGLAVQAEVWLEQTLALPAEVSVDVRAATMTALARVQAQVGRDGLELAREAVTLADRSGDPQVQFIALLAQLHFMLIKSGTAEETRPEVDGLMARYGEAAARSGKPHLMAMFEVDRATLAAERGDQAEQIMILERTLGDCRRIGFKRGMAMCLAGLAAADATLDQLDRAEARAAEALGLVRSLHLIPFENELLGILSWIHLERGDLERAESIALERLEISDRMGSGWVKAMSRLRLSSIWLEMGRTEEAWRELETVRHEMEGHAVPWVWTSLHHTAGRLALVRNEFPTAVQEMEAALSLAEEKLSWGIAVAKTWLSAAVVMNGETDRGHDLVKEPLALANRGEELDLLPVLLDVEALVSVQVGEMDRAAVLLGCAEGIRERSGRVALRTHRVFRDAARTRAEEALGQERFSEAFDRGRNEDVATVVGELIS